MVKRRQERTAKALGETAKYELEQRSSTGDTNDGRGEDADAVGGIGEVLGPSEDGSATGEGESSNDLITVMEAMEVRMEELAEWDELEVDKDSVEEEGGDWGGGLLLLEAIGLLTHDAEPGDTNLVDSCNSFNGMSRLAILWTVCHR